MNKQMIDDKAHWEEVASRIYRELPRNRFYALSDGAKTALGAFAQAWREVGGSFAEKERFGDFLTNEVGPLVPQLFQQQPSGPTPLPKPWIDPVTGAQLPNPWLTNDNRAKVLLEKRDPTLAKHFQAMAKSPYEHVAQMQDAEAAGARRKLIKYDEATHQTNPFVVGNLTETGRVTVTDPERAEVYKREAQPIHLPWESGNRNLTGMGRLAKNPQVRAIASRAEEIQMLWLTEQLSYTKSELEQKATEAQRLEAALNGRARR